MQDKDTAADPGNPVPEKTGLEKAETEAASGRTHPVEFSGRAGEFFKIWIINLFLSIITLGIYSAWAKVRTRRYFYAHTSIGGHSFDYLANPVNILKGHLIVGFLFIAYSVSGHFNAWAGIGFLIFFYLILPLLIYKSIRFYTHNSAYRNIRFQFDGTVWESYQLYLLAPVLIPLTLGLYFPYWAYLQKRWFFENTAFGSTFNDFSGKKGVFYKTYLFAFLQGVLMIGGFSLIVGFGTAAGSGAFAGEKANQEFFIKAGFVIMIGIYIVSIMGVSIVQQYVFARITNYCWDRSRLGRLRVKSALKARRLFWIRFTNILAIVLSLGLLIPWAKIRRTRYVLSCLQVDASGGFNAFTTAAGKDVSAVGDAATDFFDFDIGL